MHISRLLIRNIRSIEALIWEPDDDGPGWHVILGENGSGKSSVLRSLALALIGPKEALATRQNWNTWLRSEEDYGLIRIDLRPDPDYDSFSGKGRVGHTRILSAALSLSRVEDSSEVVLGKRAVRGQRLSPERHIWGHGSGWFSAAYGPFRRFAGGDKEAERSFFSNPRLGAHISVFGENVALTESLYWLRDLNYKELEHSPEARLLPRLKEFVNQDGFLPHRIKLTEISSNGVVFEDANGARVAVDELSDGYRSLLSMTFELIRQVSRVYPDDAIFNGANEKVVVPGVVMIDEPDAHLHPTWQRKIGFWLTEHFPNIQFIVSTHSPLICQAAVTGSVFLLPQPGTDDEPKMLAGAERDRLLYGDILDAYSTEAFGSGVTASRTAHRMKERLAALNVKEMNDGLSSREKQEQARLRAAFPTLPDPAA